MLIGPGLGIPSCEPMLSMVGNLAYNFELQFRALPSTPHPCPHMVARDSTVVSARSLQTRITPLLFFRGGAPPGAPGPCRGPGASWDRGWRKDEPAPLDMLSKAAEEGLLGCGCCVLRVCLLGRLHAARQIDFQDLRCTLHPDLVRHQLELSVLPVVLRRARVQVHREAVSETEIQVKDP